MCFDLLKSALVTCFLQHSFLGRSAALQQQQQQLKQRVRCSSALVHPERLPRAIILAPLLTPQQMDEAVEFRALAKTDGDAGPCARAAAPFVH